MHEDERAWANLREAVRMHWARLSDGDLDAVAGRRDRLLEAIRVRYGWAPDRAERELDEFMTMRSRAVRTSGPRRRTVIVI